MKSDSGREWRDVPGFDGMYQASDDGFIRSWKWGGEARRSQPRVMKPYRKKKPRRDNREFVRLISRDGKPKEIAVLKIMVNTWFGGCPAGKIPYHINGSQSDHHVVNIGFATRSELGKICGVKSHRRAVIKILEDGTEVEIYRSSIEAAKANFVCKDFVLDRCHNRIRKPFAYGFSFKFER